MTGLTRRSFLRGVPPALAVGTTVAAPAMAEAVTMTAQERYDHHLAELKKAAEELDPKIGRWDVKTAPDDECHASYVIVALRKTGTYQGDGTYENGRASVLGRHTLYQVRLLPDRIDGHRTFEARTGMDRMVLTEPAFDTFIGRKIA